MTTDDLREKLLAANDILRTVIDENPNIILMKDWDGRFLIGNRALANLYGTTPDELVGKDDGAFNPNAEQVAFYLQNVRDIMTKGETQIVMEESTDVATGETRYYQSIKKPLLTKDGKRQILVIANDVTDLKRTQQKLEASEKRLSYVLDATREGVWDWDIASGNVSHNLEWCRIVGLDDGYLQHPLEQFVSLLHEEDKPSVMARIQACLDHGELYQSEHRMRLADGRVVWVLDRGGVVERDAAGKPLRMVGSFVNINERKAAELALEVRESYLRATLDNFPFLIWLKDRESRFMVVNQEFAKAAGRGSAAELVGLTDADIWPADLARVYREDDAEVMRSGHDKSTEELLESGGKRIHIETYKHPVVASDGAVIGTVGFARDITERREMQAALLKSEERWQLALEGNNDGIWDWDLGNNIVYYSQRWQSMLGYDKGQIGNSLEEWSSRVHPDDLMTARLALDSHMAGETPHYEIEHRMLCKDGSYKWILSRGKAVFDEQGRPMRMVGSHTDITSRRESEEALQDRNQQLDTIFSMSPDGLLVFGDDHQVRFANAAFYRITHLTAEDVTGLDELGFRNLMLSLCSVKTSFPSFADLDRRARLAEGEKQSVILHLIRGARIVEVYFKSSSAASVSHLLYFRDITHEWEVAQMKSEFLSTAAHELRTPMASIYGYAELLNDRAFDAQQQKEMLAVILEQSQMVNSIINELLDLSRIEARRGKDFSYEKFDLCKLLQAVIDNIGVRTPGRLRLTLARDDAILRGDRKKITQALNNVLSNAMKYSAPDSRIEVRLDAGQIDEVNFHVIKVIDQGIGMSTEEVAKVFDRFYRADKSGKVPGTGLGMSIVKEIIELHLGKVRVLSERGTGTTVELWLPDY